MSGKCNKEHIFKFVTKSYYNYDSRTVDTRTYTQRM